MEPLKSGNYPVEMATYVKKRLPKFSKQQSSMLKGSFDFIGLNYYSAKYAANGSCLKENLRFSMDSCVNLSGEFHLFKLFAIESSVVPYLVPILDYLI